MSKQNKDSHNNDSLDNRPRKTDVILVTGGAGFIGCNFINYLFKQEDFKGSVINADRLTYAGNLESLSHIDRKYGVNGENRYFFHQVDICNYEEMELLFDKYAVDIVVHFAAESHVDRSIHGPKDFIQTNIMGTFTLLEIARKRKEKNTPFHFHHVSTDEVFGSLGQTGFFYENTPYDPRSPYSASKASSDHLVNAYAHTYGLSVTMSNCSNNYGPYQFPEKLIPLMILNATEGKHLPVYGDGLNVRDWLYVEDHCSAIYAVIKNGRAGETYNVGGESEETNIAVVKQICAVLEELLPVKENAVLRESAPQLKNYLDLITYVTDRPGHDRRYAINCDKIKNELGWSPSVSFAQGLEQTIRWYLDNTQWIEGIRSGDYKKWIHRNYETR